MRTHPAPGHHAEHFGTCQLHGLPCCSVCCKHEGDCQYGDCNRPAAATIACFAEDGRLIEERPACRKHATWGPLGVGYGHGVPQEKAA